MRTVLDALQELVMEDEWTRMWTCKQEDGRAMGTWMGALKYITKYTALRTCPSGTDHPELPLEVNLKYHNINCICLSEGKTETQVLELLPGFGTCTLLF